MTGVQTCALPICDEDVPSPERGRHEFRGVGPGGEPILGHRDGKPIRVDVGGKTLTKVFQYCKKHAYSDGYDVSAWDAKFIAKFIGDPGLETLYDLILRQIGW